ncbi:lectin ADEL-like [Aplysia californica]|uniref:Lectin ADEL-like n=1 Tax=Aplysia californica TaxID=6500 RepID=A0ABM1VZ42_APLCA|nr:lectin ADEL-like [Aplysia californica]
MSAAVVLVLFSVLTATQACEGPDVCNVIRMESWSYEYSEKIVENATWVLNMTVVDRQSATECTLGESFGYQKATLWVNHGCRAAFKVCYLPVRSTKCKVLTMESLNYEYAEQKVKKAALFINMTVEDQQSEASCDLDKSFGFDNPLR